jgi:hypothetical protein
MNNQNNVVNFSNLGRKGREIRKTFGEGIEKIEIYNPSPEKKKEIEKIISKSFSEDGKELALSPEDLILDIIPLCTNICLDLKRDSAEDMEMVRDIIEDPHPTFEDAIFEIKDLMKEISGRYIETIKTIAELPKEELEKLIKDSLPKETELTEKELKKLELQRQLEELDKE